MSESEIHETTKRREAGKGGKTEAPTPGGRLDAATDKRAVEVERSGSPQRLQRAATKLKNSGKPTRVLVVPQKDLAKGREALRKAGVSGTVKNMSGTKSTHVGVQRATPQVRRSRTTRSKR